MAEFVIKKGDLLPKIRIALTNTAGTALDLTGATAEFRMRLREGAIKVDDAVMSVVAPATGGIVEYTWAGTDTDTVGVYDSEVILTYVNGTQTIPSAGFVTVIVAPTLA